MPSNRKVVFANGEFYHLFNRGVEKRPVFTNRKQFLRAIDLAKYYRFKNPPLRYSKYLTLEKEQKHIYLSQLKQKSIEIVAFCLMNNHFHFLVKQLEANGISKFMSNFMNSYTKYFNTKYERVGPLFQGAFKAVHVESDEQLIHLSRYIHLNPVTGFKVRLDELNGYEWSSYPDYVNKTDGFLDKDIITDFFKKVEKYQSFVLDQAKYKLELINVEHLTID